MLLMGCASSENNQESDIVFKSKVYDIVDIKENEQEELLEELVEENDGISMYYRDDGETEGCVQQQELLVVRWLDEENAKSVESILPIPFSDLAGIGNTLENTEYVQRIENGYGMVVHKDGDMLIGNVIISHIELKDQVKNDWLKEICGNDLLLRTVTKGEYGELYELATPAYITDSISEMYTSMPLSQYQIFVDNTGKVEKIVLMIKQSKDWTNGQLGGTTEEELQPLVRAVQSLDETVDTTELVQNTLTACSNKDYNKQLSLGTNSYQVTTTECERYGRTYHMVQTTVTF